MTQFEIDSFATASGGGGGVVSGAYQLSGIYQVSGEYAFDFAKQISGLYVTHSGGFYAPSGSAGVGGGGTVSGWAQASGLYVEHSGGLYQPSGVYVGASGGLYQASGIFQTSGVFQTSGLYVTHSGGFYQPSGIYQVSGDYPLAHTKQASGIYLLTSGGLYQVSGIYPTSGLFALSGTGGVGGGGTSGFIHAGTFLGSGNSSNTLYTLSHGLGQVPDGISVDAASPQARGDIDISGNASGIFVTYTNPPLSGDVKLSWVAGPSASAGGIISGLFALSGAGGLGGVSGVVHAATFLGSGDNSISVYTLSHGLGIAPKGISVEAGSPAARGSFDVSGDASNIYVKYPVPPVSGDVRLSWIAGPTDVVNLVMGSGWVHAATFLGSGDNSTKLYTLSHGLERIPTGISVQAASPQARGDYDVSGNASGIYVTYTSPPLSGDVKLSWVAGPSTISNIVTLGSGTVHAATFLGSGNASTTTYTLSHGIGAVPQGLVVSPMSPNARGDFDVSGNASGIFVTYPIAPASGDVKLSWMAGPSTLVTISGNLVHGGEFIGSGNNSTTQYTLSHGLGLVPSTVIVKEGSPQARGLYDVSGNASGLFVTYTSPPASGTVRLFWQAGPTSIAVINAQSGIYTITSGSSINGVISGTPTFNGSITFSGNPPSTIPFGAEASVFVYKSGTNYYARDRFGSIIDQDTDPTSVIQSSVEWIQANNSPAGGVVKITNGLYTLTDAVYISGNDLGLVGEEPRAGVTQIRPASGKAVVQISKGSRNYVGNLYLNVAAASGAYSGFSALLLKPTTGTDVSYNTCEGLFFYDNGTGNGNAIGMETASGDIHFNTFRKINTIGFENVIHAKCTAAPNFINDGIYENIYSLQPTRFCLVNTNVSGIYNGHHFTDVRVQCAAGITDVGFEYRAENSGYATYQYHDNVFLWDLPLASPYALLNDRCSLSMMNCVPSYKISGDGMLRVYRADVVTRREGVATFSGDGSTTAFNVSHGLGFHGGGNIAPNRVFIEYGSVAAASGDPHYISNITTTQFRVNFLKAPLSGTSNITIYWKVDY